MPLDCAKFFSRSHNAVIRVYDDVGNLIETYKHKGDFREPYREFLRCLTDSCL